MSDVPEIPPVPQSLLAPLLQWSGEVLRELKAQDVPPSVRPMLGFDRRGFASAAARTQLQRALETETEFRQRVFDAFSERDESQAVLRDWTPDASVRVAAEAAERDDLPLLASALIAIRPEAWEIGLGVVLALHEQGLARQAEDDDRQAFETQVRKAEEAQRRADAELARVRAEFEDLAEELRAERASRREREDAVRAEAEQEGQRAQAVQAELADLRERLERAEARVRQEADRASSLQAELRGARAELAGLQPADGQPADDQAPEIPPALDPGEARVIREALDIVERLLAREGYADDPRAPRPARPDRQPGPRDDREAGEPATAPGGPRVRVPVPPGMVGPSVDGLREVLRGGTTALVVDGYNVSKLAWPDAPIDAQRQRLCALLERLHLRTQASTTVVFDGADVVGVRPPRRPGVRVLFSAAGQEADDVVVSEVEALPRERPVVVVSSDRQVQVDAEAQGALAVPSDVFVEFIRK